MSGIGGNQQPWPGAQPPDATTKHRGLMTRQQAQTLADATTKLATLEAPVFRLNFNQAADLFSGVAIAANTWTNVGAAQTFAITSPTSAYLLSVGLGLFANFAGSAYFLGLRVLIDGTGVNLSGAVANAPWGTVPGGAFLGNNLAAGNHTVQVQVQSNQAVALYLRAATAPNFEFLRVQVVELSR